MHEDATPKDDSPDAPLAMASSSSSPSRQRRSSSPDEDDDSITNTAFFPRPKWLSSSSSSSRQNAYPRRQPIYITLLSSLATLLRPRLTARYIILTLLLTTITLRLLTSPHLLASPLPSYTGPHGVGAIDVEIPLPQGPVPVSDATLKDGGRPAFEVETLLATLYYPTSKSFHSKRHRYYWFPKPIAITAQGYARLAGADNFLTRPIFTFVLWALGGGITIPAEVDAPLLAMEEQEEDKFPLMVFSHGFASSRTDYTNFLGELASRGHIIAAIEHRDGSGPGSLVQYPKDKDSDKERPPDRKVLPIRSTDLTEKMDTPTFKATQLAFRDAEIQAAIDLLTTIDTDVSSLQNSRSPSRDPYTTLSTWKDRLDFSLLTIGGHSYGATGALQALSTTNISHPQGKDEKKGAKAAAGLILDPGKSSGPLNNVTAQPLLLIHSNSWSRAHSPFHGRPHFDTVRDLALLSPKPSWFLTSIGTSHPSVTDAPLIEPLLLSWTTGATLDVKQALGEYVRVSVEFLDFVAGKAKGELLSEEVTHEQYGEWVSEEREKEFPKDLAKLWEIHVSPHDE